MGIRADELDSIRATVLQFLPDKGTITRTGTMYDVFADKSSGRLWRPTGQPRYAGVPFWEITFVWDADVVTGDEIVVVGMGSYVVTYTDAPESYDCDTTAWCIRTKDENGNDLWPIVTTDIVTFSKEQHPAPIPTTGPTKVRIYPVRDRWDMQQFWTAYQWAIDYQPSVRYQAPYATLAVTVNDTLHWTRASDGKVLTPKLEHPMTNNDPIMPIITALFKELF